MSVRVVVRDYPNRAIALVTPTHVLVFRHSPSTAEAVHNGSLTSIQSIQSRTSTDISVVPRCIVEFAEVDTVDLKDYRTLVSRPVHGTLGLISVNNDVFICLVTSAERVAIVRPGETVERIRAVQFHCLNSSNYDPVRIDDIDSYENGYQENYYGQNLSRRDPQFEHPCAALQELLSNGSFYFSTDFDLTNRLQDRSVDALKFDIDNLDEGYLWNQFMIGPLVKFRARLVPKERDALDASRILTSAIRGFVFTSTIPLASSPIRTSDTGLPSQLTLISRLSCRRAGTRFNSRGIDDDGNVANFVQTEIVFWSPTGICFSYAQVRGSVPVFWEQQPGLIPNQQNITITRSKEGTQPAFDKHFQDLEQTYGAVHVVNLLSKSKPNEAELTTLYKYGIKHSSLNAVGVENSKDHELLKETEFDFHAEVKRPEGYEAAGLIRHAIEPSAVGFAYYLAKEVSDPPEASGDNTKRHKRSTVVLQQEGVFRTNCLDCLDRTNLVQTIISQMALEMFFGQQRVQPTSDFWARHSGLWADNGDALSVIYAGTGALKSSFTRHGKMSLAGAIADIKKSAARLYINNFADKDRQTVVDHLLGRLVGQSTVHLYDPINDFVTTELTKRSAEYSSSKSISIWAGTFNLNGRSNGVNSDLSEWLCPDPYAPQPDIMAVAFQEIVELSPQQIMNSDPTRKAAWEETVRKTLNRHSDRVGGEDYILLRSGQLVGAALCIFVKASVLYNIKNVEGSLKKTGLSGMAGNKGAVAIRMDYANTPICFVTAHLAAGFANYDERNKDYYTIHHGLRFQRNRSIDDHEAVIWMGDFNYRIGMSADRVKGLIATGDLETMYANDQLNIQMVAGLTFPHYSEARITFLPTYKFDLGSDKYDSSEKARIPAWTDRILRKGTNLRQMSYGTAPLRFSDHRPVFATFQCTVSIIDELIREQLSKKLYEKRRADVGTMTASSRNEETDDEDFIGYDAIEPGLPPASSDRRKWWIENGLPARSSIQPPKRGAALNPNRPSNPFTPSDEPDWVNIPTPMRTNTLESFQSAYTASSAASSVNPRGRPGRKLPPPFEGASGDSSPTTATTQPPLRLRHIPPPKSPPQNQSKLQSSQVSAQQPQPPVQPPRKTSTTSNASSNTISSTKRPGPPVAKKPTHLASASNSPVPTQYGFVAPPKTITTIAKTDMDYPPTIPTASKPTAPNVLTKRQNDSARSASSSRLEKSSRNIGLDGAVPSMSISSNTQQPPHPPPTRLQRAQTQSRAQRSRDRDRDRERTEKRESGGRNAMEEEVVDQVGREKERNPRLPPRPKVEMDAPKVADDGLLDRQEVVEGEGDLKGWAVLKPS